MGQIVRIKAIEKGDLMRAGVLRAGVRLLPLFDSSGAGPPTFPRRKRRQGRG